MHSMYSKALFGILCFSLGVLVALAAGCSAQEENRANLRIEATYGLCKYGKAQDGTWYKNGYDQSFGLNSKCWSAGISQAAWHTPAGLFGYRVSYVDFGLAKADTVVPIIDAEANSHPTGANCNPSTFSGCVGHYKQAGRAKGISFGPILENQTRYGTFGVEGGFYYFHSNWHVNAELPTTPCGGCTPQAWEWDGAANYHTTWYTGLTYEYSGFFVQARKYHAVYASDAKKDPLFIGLISGPLVSVQAGYQFKF